METWMIDLDLNAKKNKIIFIDIRPFIWPPKATPLSGKLSGVHLPISSCYPTIHYALNIHLNGSGSEKSPREFMGRKCISMGVIGIQDNACRL